MGGFRERESSAGVINGDFISMIQQYLRIFLLVNSNIPDKTDISAFIGREKSLLGLPAATSMGSIFVIVGCIFRISDINNS